MASARIINSLGVKPHSDIHGVQARSFTLGLVQASLTEFMTSFESDPLAKYTVEELLQLAFTLYTGAWISQGAVSLVSIPVKTWAPDGFDVAIPGKEKPLHISPEAIRTALSFMTNVTSLNPVSIAKNCSSMFVSNCVGKVLGSGIHDVVVGLSGPADEKEIKAVKETPDFTSHHMAAVVDMPFSM